MNFYFAPMEGLTGYIYRNAHNEFFKPADKYFSPFIVTNQNNSFKTREWNDILPENNNGLKLVPQLLSNNARDFVNAAEKISELGYTEINLNLGCPSGTVVAKNKGAGFLAKRDELNAFLDEIFSHLTMKISIKTRIGKDHPEEFYELINIFNQYPLEELIIHPRIQKDFYKNTPNMEVFRDATALSKTPLCYNGDIFSAGDYHKFKSDFPEVDTLMLGRGLLTNPGMISDITDGGKLEKHVLKAFHDRICRNYSEILSGERDVLFKMKELWFYMIPLFADHEKHAKKIKKAVRLRDYEEAVSGLFADLDMMHG